jgi:hypothetical protein
MLISTNQALVALIAFLVTWLVSREIHFELSRHEWDRERKKLLEALMPGLSLIEDRPSKRRWWDDSRRAAVERERKRLDD